MMPGRNLFENLENCLLRLESKYSLAIALYSYLSTLAKSGDLGNDEFLDRYIEVVAADKAIKKLESAGKIISTDFSKYPEQVQLAADKALTGGKKYYLARESYSRALNKKDITRILALKEKFAKSFQ
ncbi:MAG: hypothetical protein LBJ18_04385 [Rickettsiales bacterium]|nr:hypothetical protein [Rickettsiales bacterium]